MAKLFNAIAIWDVYIVAETPEAAVEALRSWIASGDLKVSEQTCLEARHENNIRASWRDEKPLVGADVSDDDFEKIVKGHTTLEAFQKLYTKQTKQPEGSK